MDAGLANGLLMIVDCVALALGCYAGANVLFAYFTNRIGTAFVLCLPTAVCVGGVALLTKFIAERDEPIETLYAVMTGMIVFAGIATVVRLLLGQGR